MKTKNKLMAMVEIAVVLCAVFLVALPAITADQSQTTQKVSTSEVTTASEDDYVLGVYGNANEDDTIDMGDVVYTKLAIFGKKPKTELCDAKYDGRINVLDVIQTKLIILGKEKELTVIDGRDYIVTVEKPIKRVAVFRPNHFETLRSLGVSDRIVGVPKEKLFDPAFFPEMEDLPSYGSKRTPDIEVILNTDPDVVIFWASPLIRDGLKTADPSIVQLNFESSDRDYEIYRKDVKKLGYIFDREDIAEELLDFQDEIRNSIKAVVDTIPEEDKPRVFAGLSGSGPSSPERIALSGGKDIREGLTGKLDPEYVIKEDPEVVIVTKWFVKSCPSDQSAYSPYGRDRDDVADLAEAINEFMNTPHWMHLTAVKTERVFVDPNALTTASGGNNGARGFVQIAYQAKSFHPTLFEDMDPRAIHQEYITRFQGLDIDLDKKGVFWYPEP